ncbi:GL17617 [Drosophila persimilis]|uniref:GL17617 n=1 Tax=Drosophila persimilis TaxID=7234 RepID=B4IQT7_DROPE|nr:GL17617 [Drosophila persimilis]
MGALKFQFGDAGKRNGQLFYPRKVAVFQHNGNFVVCDRGNRRSRMQIFSKCGTYMFKISIRFMDIVTGLAVSTKGYIVAVDSVSPTVFVISEEGMLLHWFDCSVFVREPSDIAIRDNVFYLCDMKAHGVAVFKDSGEFLYRIGNERVSCYPTGIDISSAGDLLIGDTHGYRFHVTCYGSDGDFNVIIFLLFLLIGDTHGYRFHVTCYGIDGVFMSVFEFPQLNVSRCCGLKITSEGYVVTLAKNNHQVLVMDLLVIIFLLFLLIGDTHGYRFHVTCYGIDGVFMSVFEFPQLNVSRCCGLKITSEGYVVTLAKNNHQVLVMDLLYV